MPNFHYTFNLQIKFAEVVQKYPSRIALRYPDKTEITYQELDVLSNKLSGFLILNNFVKGDVVAIFNEKSPLAYVLMLACIKNGIVYTNLDVTSPWSRVDKIIKNCKPVAVFYDKDVKQIFLELAVQYPHIQQFHLGSARLNEESLLHQQKLSGLNQDSSIHGNDPLYIMFTSGSTGFPKGAVMSHNNVLNFIDWGKETFSVTEEDIFTNANPIYFDNSVFDFYVSIFNGATLVPLSHDLVKQPQALVKAINASNCTIWFSVPSLLVYLLTTKALTENDFKTVRRISFGGEGFPKNKLKNLFDLFGHRMDLFNVYGPTECTCICSSYKITKDDFENMNELAPLGYMAPNFGYYIIPHSDNNINLGELCLMGPCVGLGYYNDPERTSVSFVQYPNAGYHQRMYKTGDLVERASNEYLHFKGRIDNQIKHMGYRIELEEIEAAFSSLPAVDEAGVIYEKINAELGQIKAFVVVNDMDMNNEKLLKAIKKILPPYMLPRTIKIMKVLPKNQNGKIDRNQLKTIK